MIILGANLLAVVVIRCLLGGWEPWDTSPWPIGQLGQWGGVDTLQH